MSDDPAASVEQYARNLAAASYPKPEDVPGLPNAFRRRWVLRLSTRLPPPEVLETAVKSFEASARWEIATAQSELGDLEQSAASASAVRLDDHHLILEIDCPSPAAKANVGDAATIVTLSILRAADQQWQLEDLQGIPKRYWFILR
jgi:hypothetical protein